MLSPSLSDSVGKSPCTDWRTAHYTDLSDCTYLVSYYLCSMADLLVQDMAHMHTSRRHDYCNYNARYCKYQPQDKVSILTTKITRRQWNFSYTGWEKKAVSSWQEMSWRASYIFQWKPAPLQQLLLYWSLFYFLCSQITIHMLYRESLDHCGLLT